MRGIFSVLFIFIFTIKIAGQCNQINWCGTWASEQGDGWTMPNGLLGCRFFNFNNPFNNGCTIFEGWNQTFSDANLCFEGAIASVMLQMKWPERSVMNGYFRSEELLSIDHQWLYQDIINVPNGNWSNDNPRTRQLSVVVVPDYSSVADEITRLFSVVSLATNTADWRYVMANDASQQQFHTRLLHILKNRLGYVNAKIMKAGSNAIPAPDPLLLSTVITSIRDKQQPVLGVGSNNNSSSGHMWVMDGYRYNTTHELHICGHGYKASSTFCQNLEDWTPSSSWQPAYNNGNGVLEVGAGQLLRNIIYDLDPTVSVNSGTTSEFCFVFGDDQIPNTSGTSRTGCFRFKNFGGTAGTFNVSLYKQYYNSGNWVDVSTIINNLNCNFSTGQVNSGVFNYDVPVGDSVRLRLTIQNTFGSQLNLRMVLDDQETKNLKILKVNTSYGKRTLLNFSSGGNMHFTGTLGTNGSCSQNGVLTITNTGTCETALREGNIIGGVGGNLLIRGSQITPNGAGIPLAGSMIFKNSDQVVIQQKISGDISIAGKVGNRPLLIEPLSIVYPIGGETFTAGSTVRILWNCNTPNVGVTPAYSVNDGKTWTNMIGTVINDGLFYDWSIPASLANQTVIVRVAFYGNTNIAYSGKFKVNAA